MRGCCSALSFASLSFLVTLSTVTGFDEGPNASSLVTLRTWHPDRKASSKRCRHEIRARERLDETIRCLLGELVRSQYHVLVVVTRGSRVRMLRVLASPTNSL